MLPPEAKKHVSCVDPRRRQAGPKVTTPSSHHFNTLVPRFSGGAGGVQERGAEKAVATEGALWWTDEEPGQLRVGSQTRGPRSPQRARELTV